MLCPEDRRVRHRLSQSLLEADSLKGIDLEPNLSKGKLAGDILLRALELNDEGNGISISEAIERSTDHLSLVDRSTFDEERETLMLAVRGYRNREHMMSAWKSHRHVAHYWAALLLSGGSLPRSPTDFMNFARVASELAKRGSRLRLQGRSREMLIDVERGWRLRLPR